MLLLSRLGPGSGVSVLPVDARSAQPTGRPQAVPFGDLSAFVRSAAPDERWVWSDTTRWYPALLAAGVRVGRCHDLALCHAILRSSSHTVGSALATAPDGVWDHSPSGPREVDEGRDTLFTLDAAEPDGDDRRENDAAFELRRQWDALASSRDSGRLRLLLAAESAGALVAAELRHVGLPWRADRHERMLAEVLGPRPARGERPAILEELAARLRTALEAPTLNPDSPPELVRALRRAGINTRTTRSHELVQYEHPAIAPLLEYKKLARLLSANGWAWQDEWVRDGRFHAEYIPGGVVTGRWAARGGGVLQLPKQVRSAVVADPGWKLVVADAAQLEPRILAALSQDNAMADAGRGRDLYDGIVAAGVVEDRAHAKVAMLGAMYGATTGDSARLMPALSRAYPRAVGYVEQAARTGEAGGVVTTWLGRSSPEPAAAWHRAQEAAALPGATAAAERKARSVARDWGRFTRNFVVQGTAAEWALCWMAGLRGELAGLGGRDDRVEAGAHLAYFLHDEVIVHTPEAQAAAVVEAVRRAAQAAGELLFGNTPVTFPVTADVVDCYADAK